MSKQNATVTNIAANGNSEHLNKYEMTSVQALLAYAAFQQNVEETTVRDTVAKRFGVEDVTQLPRSLYDEVIRFLVDIQYSLLLH